MPVTFAKGVQWSTPFPQLLDSSHVQQHTQGQTESIKVPSPSSVSIDCRKLDKNLSEQLAAAAKALKQSRMHMETLPFLASAGSLHSMQEAKHGSRLIPLSLRPDDEGWRVFVARLAEPPWSFNVEHVSAVTNSPYAEP